MEHQSDEDIEAWLLELRDWRAAAPAAAPALAPATAQTPATQATVPKVGADVGPDVAQAAVPGPVTFKLSGAAHAGAVLQHAHDVIEHLKTQGPLVFKIGATKHPMHRWANRSYGYKFEKAFNKCALYTGMIVLIETDNAQAAGFGEAAVICRFHGQPGCMNTGLGGEGIGHTLLCKHYVYVVYGFSA